jgi:hypothetical protein
MLWKVFHNAVHRQPHCLCIILYRQACPAALWPPQVYNLNYKEQLAAQCVRKFAPADRTTDFLDARLDEKRTLMEFQLTKAPSYIVFKFHFVFCENYESLKLLSGDILVSVSSKDLRGEDRQARI